MSLARARLPDGRPVGLDGGPPFSCEALRRLVGVPFELPHDDPWVLDGGDAAHGYLDAARRAWVDEPTWMDFLDPSSPAHRLKIVERDLYLHHWDPWLARARAVLDVGCGIGRMTLPMLARGHDVVGVDADLASLHRCAWHAAGLPGRLDLRWSSVHALPDVTVDTVIACEVLCYVPEVEVAVEGLVARLTRGGTLLLSMEARWGWACAPDASPGTVAHALVGDGVIDQPGEGWVRTWEEEDLVDLLEDAGLAVEAMVPTNYVLDGPLEAVTDGVPELEVLLDLEEAARAHPVWSPLNRLWTAAAVRR